MSRRHVIGKLLLTSLLTGVPAYFMAFLFAYGFKDRVSAGHHLAFLMAIAAFATFAGCAAASGPVRSSKRGPGGQAARFAVLVSFALNAAVVGAGSIVSAAHKDEGSVSADFTTGTDILVAAALFAVAIGCATAAGRVDVASGASARR